MRYTAKGRLCSLSVSMFPLQQSESPRQWFSGLISMWLPAAAAAAASRGQEGRGHKMDDSSLGMVITGQWIETSHEETRSGCVRGIRLV